MNVLRRLRTKAGGAPLVVALAAVLTLGAGQGLADEWQVRMPVKKTARIAPQADQAEAQNASGAAQPGTPAPKAAPKTALGRAAEAAAAAKTAAKPSAQKAPADKSLAEKTAEPAPAKPETKPAADRHDSAKSSADADQAEKTASEPAVPGKAAKPAAVAGKTPTAPPQAAPKPPKPAPVVIDPKATKLPPAATASTTPLALPKEGQWVGDLYIEFKPESIVLHAAANAPVERVTWFNVVDGGPRKLAVDLRGPWRKKGASVLRFDVGPVKNVVVGEHEDRLRFSLEFRDGAVAKELSPVLEKVPGGMSLAIPLAVRLAP